MYTIHKNIFLVALCITGIQHGNAQKKQFKTGASITVIVENIKSNKGKVYVGLYNSKLSYLKQPVRIIESKIVEKKAKAVFENVYFGTYAVICYHDKNGNGFLDLDKTGKPKEPYNVSNNDEITMPPPEFDKASFEVGVKDISLRIKLN